jgi:hypothetical protein
MNYEIDPEKLIALIFIIGAGYFIFRNLFMNQYFSKKITLIIMIGFVFIGLFRFIYNYRNKKLGKKK